MIELRSTGISPQATTAGEGEGGGGILATAAAAAVRRQAESAVAGTREQAAAHSVQQTLAGAPSPEREGFQWELPSTRNSGPPPAAEEVAPVAEEATVTRTGGQVVIDAGDGDDRIRITQDATSGDITVDVNGEEHTFSGSDRNRLVIRGGDGNDWIQTDAGVTVHLTIEGGDGNDFIRGGSGNDRLDGGAGNDEIHGGVGHDTIEAGAGNDLVAGGDGRDYVNGGLGDDRLYGNAGDDVIYGGDGDDHIAGNAGNDFVDGGTGADFLSGNEGNDIVSGGAGDDEIWGAEGDDVLYAGGGSDRLYGSSGNDVLHAKATDAVDEGAGNTNRTVIVDYDATLGADIRITGSPEFIERVKADLEILRSSPAGQQMLERLVASGQTVTIQETQGGNAADWANRTSPGAPQPFFDTATQTPGTPNDATVSYNPARVSLRDRGPTDTTIDHTDRPPVIGLYHELSHALDIVEGTLRMDVYNGDVTADHGIRDLERSAVGLPIDHDGDPTTPEQVVTDPDLTENGLRDEMQLPPRPTYR